MKRAILLLALLLAGCAPSTTEDHEGMHRYIDTEYGIVCYWRYDGSSPISCATMK